MRTILFLLLLLTSIQLVAQKQLSNVFYCQNTMWKLDNRPETPQQKADLLAKVGFDGLEGFGYTNFFELKDALKEKGLSMPVNYVELNFSKNGLPKNNSLNEIKEMIAATDTGAILYFYVINEHYMDNKTMGDKKIVPVLQELADYAKEYQVKLCIYPHISHYTETLAHIVKLAKMVDRENFGASLNLCHLLKVEGSQGIDQKLKDYTPYLFAVNICGADDGDTQNYKWDRLIQPLGQGSFDTYQLVKTLKDNGYEGPFGMQCYNLKGDAFTVLSGIRETWEAYQERYAEGK